MRKETENALGCVADIIRGTVLVLVVYLFIKAVFLF